MLLGRFRKSGRILSFVLSSSLGLSASALAEDGTPDYHFRRVGGGVDYSHITVGGSETHRLQLTGIAETHGFSYGEGMYIRYQGGARLSLGGSGGANPNGIPGVGDGSLGFALSAAGDARFSIGALPDALRFGECYPFLGGTGAANTSTDYQEHGAIRSKALGGIQLGGEGGLTCVIGDVIAMVGVGGGVRFLNRGDGENVAPWGQADLTLRWYNDLTTRVTGEIDGGIRRATASVAVAPEALGGVSIGIEGEVSHVSNAALKPDLEARTGPGSDTAIFGQRVSLTVGGAF